MNIENENNESNIDNGKSAEQLASEHNLNLSIVEDEAAQGEHEEQGENQQTNENAQNALTGILTVIPLGLDVMGLKNTAAVWSSTVINGVSAALVPVLRKYTFGQKFLAHLENGGGVEEFALLIALAPVTLATFEAYKLDRPKVEKEVKGEEVKHSGGVHSADTPLGSTFRFASES